MRYKVGDKVKLRNDLIVGKSYGNIDFLNSMENLLNKELTIKSINYDNNTFESEETVFYLSFEMIKEYTWEDFLKAPIGTKVTFESGAMLLKDEPNLFEDEIHTTNYEDLEGFRDDNVYNLGKIIKIEEPTYTTVYEPKEEVKEMTIAEIEKELGYKIKVVKEK